ncbi:lipocalin family protein [uncultured Rikenella sp.]|uniref:lipocalin family protein n=1 Tax=uncultured Rikenella sp. TaxID=368003 RepID=UPI00260FAE5F|nr:lipocalin family protein [uncultured Rikenella sp.]
MEYETITGFDPKRYLGKWYEIARFDYRFERDMYAVTAEYSLRSDGKIRVVNTGRRGSPDGPTVTAAGKAKLGAPKDPVRPGFLKVSFFGPFYAPYYILALDSDYQCALVAGKRHKTLWILSRQPQLSQETTQQLLDVARQRGFDTSKLHFTEQNDRTPY